jgi:hypothetical protein
MRFGANFLPIFVIAGTFFDTTYAANMRDFELEEIPGFVNDTQIVASEEFFLKVQSCDLTFESYDLPQSFGGKQTQIDLADGAIGLTGDKTAAFYGPIVTGFIIPDGDLPIGNIMVRSDFKTRKATANYDGKTLKLQYSEPDKDGQIWVNSVEIDTDNQLKNLGDVRHQVYPAGHSLDLHQLHSTLCQPVGI